MHFNAENSSSFIPNNATERQVPRAGSSSWRPVARERVLRQRAPADLYGSVPAPPTLEPLLIPDRGGASAFALLTPVDETPCETDKDSNAEQQKMSIRPLPLPESQTNRRRAHTWISQSSQSHMSAGPSIPPISNHSLTNKPGRAFPHSSAIDGKASTVVPDTYSMEQIDQITASGSNRSRVDSNQRTLPIPPPPTPPPPTPPTHSTFKSHSRDQRDASDVPEFLGKSAHHKFHRQLVVVNPTEPGPRKASTHAGRRFSDAPEMKPLRSGGVSAPKIPQHTSLSSALSISGGERARARAHTTAAHSHSHSSFSGASSSQQLLDSCSSQSKSQSSVRGPPVKGGTSSSELPLFTGCKVKALPKVPILFENKVTVPETVAVFQHHRGSGSIPSEDKSKSKRRGKEKEKEKVSPAIVAKEEEQELEELVSGPDDGWDVRALPLVNEHGQLSPPDSAKGGWSPNNVRGNGSRATRPRGPRSRRSTIS